jgi:hypothetical protein
VGAACKTQPVTNLRNGDLIVCKQLLGFHNPLFQEKLMGCQAGALFEEPSEMVLAHLRQLGHPLKADVALQV